MFFQQKQNPLIEFINGNWVKTEREREFYKPKEKRLNW